MSLCPYPCLCAQRKLSEDMFCQSWNKNLEYPLNTFGWTGKPVALQ